MQKLGKWTNEKQAQEASQASTELCILMVASSIYQTRGERVEGEYPSHLFKWLTFP